MANVLIVNHKILFMKNSLKVALGIMTGGVLIFLNYKRKQRGNNKRVFTAPDGNQYKENQMYRTATGEIYKNGKKVRTELPKDSFKNQSKVDSHFNNQNLNENFSLPKNEVSYHQRGDRHR